MSEQMRLGDVVEVRVRRDGVAVGTIKGGDIVIMLTPSADLFAVYINGVRVHFGKTIWAVSWCRNAVMQLLAIRNRYSGERAPFPVHDARGCAGFTVYTADPSTMPIAARGSAIFPAHFDDGSAASCAGVSIERDGGVTVRSVGKDGTTLSLHHSGRIVTVTYAVSENGAPPQERGAGWITQEFPVADAPACWAQPLELALSASHTASTGDGGPAVKTANDPCGLCGTTSDYIPAVVTTRLATPREDVATVHLGATTKHPVRVSTDSMTTSATTTTATTTSRRATTASTTVTASTTDRTSTATTSFAAAAPKSATRSVETQSASERVTNTRSGTAGETVKMCLPTWRPHSRPMSLNQLDSVYNDASNAPAVLWSSVARATIFFLSVGGAVVCEWGLAGEVFATREGEGVFFDRYPARVCRECNVAPMVYRPWHFDPAVADDVERVSRASPRDRALQIAIDILHDTSTSETTALGAQQRDTELDDGLNVMDDDGPADFMHNPPDITRHLAELRRCIGVRE